MRNDACEKVSKIALKKAELINYGKIYVPEQIILPYPLSSSTAGPGAGKRAFALSFGGTRLKLGVTRNTDAKFSLAEKESGFQILKEGAVFVDDCTIIPTLLHAPNQAFVNLHEACIYHCEFCATPRLKELSRKNKSLDQVVEMIMDASKSQDFSSVAITSGVVGSPEKTIDDIIDVVESVKENLGDVDIGVEPYVTRTIDIERLYEAGATEIKINIETVDRKIFKAICPELDYDHILEMLGHAQTIFGRGKVATNILIGLGESDENVLNGVEHCAEMGVVSVIRVLRINDYNHKRIVEALGHDIEKVSPQRMITLALKQKEILTRHGLSTGTFETMCHKCGCCDIVPFIDV